MQPRRITETGVEDKCAVITYGGREQFFPAWTEPRSRFGLRWNGIDRATKDQLVAFYKACRGRARSFTMWNHVEGRHCQVRFTSDTLRIEHINAYFFNIEAEVREV